MIAPNPHARQKKAGEGRESRGRSMKAGQQGIPTPVIPMGLFLVRGAEWKGQ